MARSTDEDLPVPAGEDDGAALCRRALEVRFDGRRPDRFEEARRLFLAAAARGDANAMTWLGGLYSPDLGHLNAPGVARMWYARAAARGSRFAATRLAAWPERTAMRQAARAGDVAAAKRLAEMLRKGEGGMRDSEGAMRWCQVVAAHGDAEAMNDLGDLYAAWQTPEGWRLARTWYERAARRGEKFAMMALADEAWHGTGVYTMPDPAAASRWFRQLAERHDWGIGKVLRAHVYAHGIGVPCRPQLARRLRERLRWGEDAGMDLHVAWLEYGVVLDFGQEEGG